MSFNYDIFNKELETIDFNNVKVINTINPHSYCVANGDLEFKSALEASDILLPDGIGIVWAEKFLKGKRIEKIAGYDLFFYLMTKLELEKGSAFFMGASQSTLDKIKIKCSIDFPNVKVATFSPPFKDVFSKEDTDVMCQNVNACMPNVLFVGMTAPKQEIWVHNNKNRLNANLICSVGAVFDFYAGNIERAPTLMIKMGLEWLHRSLNSRRLLKRNFVSNPKFIMEVLKLKFK
jgi:N-acetylglucosaminyldiphosphoundecaprenol N-acetyl-beta-D-mannosaminyltransferase